jgi:hypothetical protein
VQRIILRGIGEANRGIGGAGGLGGIGARADTKQQVRRRRVGTFVARSPSHYLLKVQSRRVCLRGKGRIVRLEMHGRGVREAGGHLSGVKRRLEVLWGCQTLEESACNNKQTDIFSAKRQGFEGVRNGRKSHEWGGGVGRERTRGMCNWVWGGCECHAGE